MVGITFRSTSALAGAIDSAVQSESSTGQLSGTVDHADEAESLAFHDAEAVAVYEAEPIAFHDTATSGKWRPGGPARATSERGARSRDWHR